MEQLKESILKKYQRATKKFIKNELKQKGYILTPEHEILKLDVFNNKWNVQELEQVTELINNYVFNWWNIPTETTNEIILNNLIELLPVANKEQLTNYINYIETSKDIIKPKELKKQVKELISNNEKRHKQVFNGGINSPEYQSQALINNNVFYDKTTSNYYIFKKENNKFVKLTNMNILYYLEQEFNKNIPCDPFSIMDYMKTSYLFFVTNSNLPSRYNTNLKRLEFCDRTKNDYELINKIVSSFE